LGIYGKADLTSRFVGEFISGRLNAFSRVKLIHPFHPLFFKGEAREFD